MGISYRIEDDVLHLSLEGEFTKDDVLGYRAEVKKHAAYHVGMRELVDCRRMSSLLSADDLRALASRMERPAGGYASRCAVLVPSDVVYGLVRMFEVYIDRFFIDLRPFRDSEEATAWLKS